MGGIAENHLPKRNHNNSPELLPLERPSPQRRAYRIAEVCALLGFSRATFWRRRQAGLIKLTYIGDMPFVTAAHLAELLGEGPTP
jgi:hypothetical protein